MEQEFSLSGTYEDLQNILQKEFNLSSETARVAVAVFAYGQNQDENHEQLMEDALWFMDAKQDRYQSHIFSTRYTISFTRAKLDILDGIIVPIVLAMSGNRDVASINVVVNSIKGLMKNLRRVKDNECCVYFQTLQYLKEQSNKWFSVDNVTPKIGEDGACINLDKKWNCKFKCNGECKIQSDDVKDILEKFCDDEVMEMNEEKTLYKYKV